ncbi:MAG: DEAD/DEAH box helicase family protein [Ktedonobacteraceae bacterium]
MEVNVLHNLVQGHPGLDKKGLVRLWASHGHARMSEHQLNQQLYRPDGLFLWRPGKGTQRLWYVASSRPEEGASRTPTLAIQLNTSLDLYAWQQTALDAWHRQQCRGVVEAVTGAGKTRLALAAALSQLRQGGKVAIVVPSLGLADQWIRETRLLLGNHMHTLRIGQYGGGCEDSLHDHDVLIITVQSGSKYWILPEGANGLMIADECHHYGSPSWSTVLETRFQRRLGLTATYERNDGGVAKFLDPYFGKVCCRLDYCKALQEGVISHFKIAFIGVLFSAPERHEYDEESEKASRYRQRLIKDYGVAPDPFGQFMQEVQILSHRGEGAASRYAGIYLSAFTKRRSVLARAHGKLVRLEQVAEAVRAAERSILFAQTRTAASDAIDALRRQGIRGQVLDSSMDLHERRTVFADFESGENEIVAAPKLLDEGVDVPSADLALILASSRSRRQMIQRMGRVLRKKPDGRRARLVVFYVEDTSEDPDKGAHEDFMDLVWPAADAVQTFGSSDLPGSIIDYLNAW